MACEQERATSLIQWMDGTVDANYVSGVTTHLISIAVGPVEKKARKNSIPVMLPSWVEECWIKNCDSR